MTEEPAFNCRLGHRVPLGPTHMSVQWVRGTLTPGRKPFICYNSVTTQNVWCFRRDLHRFWSAIIFYECNDDTTALQRRILQTALWQYTC